ncbi:MAG TPA: hypothetical protein VGC59_12325 [Solirubrobacteraceae bacterium]
MDQVSRPLLIALAATVALLAIWLVALRPKPVSVDATPLAPTQAIPQAKQAAASADAATAQAQAATSAAGQATTAAPAATTAPPAATTAPPAASAATPAPAAAPATTATDSAPAASDSRRDGAILRDIRDGKVVVLLFWNARAADDIATRGAIRDLDLHGGKVAVHVVPISRVGDYPAITQGVTIAGSPTTLVIDRKRRTRVIAGLSEPQELAQAVGDALAAR